MESTWVVFIIFIMLFVFWTTGSFAATKVFKIPASPVQSMLLGSGLYSFLISVLGLFFSIKLITIFYYILSFSLLFLLRYGKINNLNPPKFTFLNAYLFAGLILTIIPSDYFDPLNYHLLSILKWTKSDSITFFDDSIALFHASYADYLYFPIYLTREFFDLLDLKNLLVTSQLLTYFLGIFSFVYILKKKLSEKLSTFWFELIVLVIITRASFQHKAFIAKNDWLCLSWFLLGCILILDRKKVGFFLMGLSVGTKISYGFSFFFFVAAFFFKKFRNEWKYLSSGIIIFCITLIPYFFRNYYFTGDLIFPLGANIFGTNNLGPSWINGLKFFGLNFNHVSWILFKEKLWRIFTYEPVVYFFGISGFFYKKYSLEERIIWILINLFLVFFIFFLGLNSELRHFGPIALMINYFAIISFVYCSELLCFSNCMKSIIRFAVIASILYNIFSLTDQLNPFPKNKVAHLELAIGFKDEFLKRIKTNKKIGVFDDTPLYYLSDLDIFRIWDKPSLDKKMYICSDLKCLINTLKDDGVELLLDSKYYFDPYYSPGIVKAINNAKKLYPEIIILKYKTYELISLNKLSAKISNEQF